MLLNLPYLTIQNEQNPRTVASWCVIPADTGLTLGIAPPPTFPRIGKEMQEGLLARMHAL